MKRIIYFEEQDDIEYIFEILIVNRKELKRIFLKIEQIYSKNINIIIKYLLINIYYTIVTIDKILLHNILTKDKQYSYTSFE